LPCDLDLINDRRDVLVAPIVEVDPEAGCLDVSPESLMHLDLDGVEQASARLLHADQGVSNVLSEPLPMSLIAVVVSFHG
jgi:hypothetical protein